MLYETLGQGWLFLLFLWLGLLCGACDCVGSILFSKILKIKYNKKWQKTILQIVNFLVDFLRAVFIVAIFFLSCYVFSYGILWLYLIIAYLFGFILEKVLQSIISQKILKKHNAIDKENNSD